MTADVHPTALVHPAAYLGDGVSIGPFVEVGEDVAIGAGTRVESRATLISRTRIGAGCRIGVGTVIGADPQDHKYHGESTTIEIGDGTTLREYVTVHRGTAASGKTVIGQGCYLMTYVHVAHDCVLGDGVVLANSVQLAGHVRIDAHAQVSGLTPIHQFVRIGTYAFVGGGSRVPQDVPPYALTAGNPMRLFGINVEGLRRAGFDADLRFAIKRAHRLLFNSRLSQGEAIDRIHLESGGIPEVMALVDFVAHSERGVLV